MFSPMEGLYLEQGVPSVSMPHMLAITLYAPESRSSQILLDNLDNGVSEVYRQGM